MDVLIRAGLIGGLIILCYKVISTFLPLMAWSIILAVTIYPLHHRIAHIVRNKQWIASAILILIGFLLIIIPLALLMNSFADSVRYFISGVQNNTLKIPPAPQKIAQWPIIGKEVYDFWSKANTDLPGLVQNLQPKIGQIAQKALAIVANIGGGFLLFLASFIISNILMAYGESGERTTHAIFRRVAGTVRGDAFVKLCTATIRAVALGVIGVAFIQALLIGLALLLAGIPSAGLLALVALVLGIAQVPALLITGPVIFYIWWSGDYSNTAALTYTIILVLTGTIDNVLKPMMLGRGVKVPMPVILFGALGGIASGGILGMFLGAIVLALGYEIFKGWIAAGAADTDPVPQK